MQLVEYSHGDGIEVVLGGGRREFTGNPDPEDENISGDRQDGRNLIQEWLAKHPNSEYVWNKTAFDEIDVNKVDHVMGEFRRENRVRKEQQKIMCSKTNIPCTVWLPPLLIILISKQLR